MPNIKISYFQSAGRAEAVRLAFTVGEIPFEDERVSFETFGKIKSTLPFGAFPSLTVDGTVYAQSGAMLRYAGRLTGLYPADDPITALRIDQIIGALDDIGAPLTAAYRLPAEEKLAAHAVVATEVIPRYMGAIENLMDGQYCVGNSITIADLRAYTSIRAIQSGVWVGIPTDIIDQFPKLTALVATLNAHPRIAAWNKTHNQ